MPCSRKMVSPLHLESFPFFLTSAFIFITAGLIESEVN